MSNKAITIAAAIFVTIVITSGIFFSLGQIQKIYKHVYETHNSITGEFNEFDAYENTKKTSVEVLNALKKYRSNTRVVVSVSGASGAGAIDKMQAEVNGQKNAGALVATYNATVVRQKDMTRINFSR